MRTQDNMKTHCSILTLITLVLLALTGCGSGESLPERKSAAPTGKKIVLQQVLEFFKRKYLLIARITFPERLFRFESCFHFLSRTKTQQYLLESG